MNKKNEGGAQCDPLLEEGSSQPEDVEDNAVEEDAEGCPESAGACAGDKQGGQAPGRGATKPGEEDGGRGFWGRRHRAQIARGLSGVALPRNGSACGSNDASACRRALRRLFREAMARPEKPDRGG